MHMMVRIKLMAIGGLLSLNCPYVQDVMKWHHTRTKEMTMTQVLRQAVQFTTGQLCQQYQIAMDSLEAPSTLQMRKYILSVHRF